MRKHLPREPPNYGLFCPSCPRGVGSAVATSFACLEEHFRPDHFDSGRDFLLAAKSVGDARELPSLLFKFGG